MLEAITPLCPVDIPILPFFPREQRPVSTHSLAISLSNETCASSNTIVHVNPDSSSSDGHSSTGVLLLAITEAGNVQAARESCKNALTCRI